MDKRRVWLERLIRVLIPLLISGLAIWWVSQQLNFEQLISVLKQMTWHGLLIHGIVFIIGLILRALSFSVILGDDFSNVTSFHGMNVGYLLNNILPLRLGEFGRGALLTSHARHPVTFLEVFAGIITERTLDLIIGLAFLVAGFFMMDGALVPMWLVWLGLALLLAFVVLAAFGAKHQERFISGLRKRHAERPFLRDKVVPWLDDLLKGFHIFIAPRKLSLASILLIVSWGFAILEVYLLQTEFMPNAEWWWAIIALTAGVFVNAIPSAPGGIGVYEFGVVAAYTALGADPAAGLAIALVMHVFQLVLPSIFGMIGIYALGDNLSKVIRSALFLKQETETSE